MDRDDDHNNNNLKQLDHDEPHHPVPDGSSSDDNDYSELLELMVKFGKKEMQDVEEEKSDKPEELKAMKARVSDRIESEDHASIFWLLMTLMYPADKQVIAAKFREFLSSSITIYPIRDHVENYPELMDTAGTELKKIKEQYPNQVGTMSTASELDSTAELFLSLQRGFTSLLFKLRMIELHVSYPPRRLELQNLVDRMKSTVKGEFEQYVQEEQAAGAKVKQALEENLKKKCVQLQSLESKAREWMAIYKAQS